MSDIKASAGVNTHPAAIPSAGLPAKFKPEEAKVNDAKLDAGITFAATVKDWAKLDLFVDEKLDHLEQLVAWWKSNVRGPGQSNSSRPGLIDVSGAEKLTGFKQPQVSKSAKRLADRGKYREAIVGAAYRAAMGDVHNHRAQGTGENEWYTPIKYVESARAVMGGIDLDPATSAVAQKAIKAERFFTIAENGLNREWRGRVWLNPPYAQPDIWNFIEKLLVELTEGRVSEAVLLTHNYTDTAWFHHAESIAAALCFTRGRIAFVDQDGEPCCPTQGQAFFYYGENTARFSDEFKRFGFVLGAA